MSTLFKKLLWFCPFGSVPEITPSDLNNQIKNSRKPQQLLDVRTDKEWYKERIKGSLHIPIVQLSSKIGDIPFNKKKHVIAICQMGSRSRPAVRILKYYGFENALQLAGGLNSWIHHKYPVETDE
jgi:rhodanese-related sulfurtransferase